MLARRTTTSCRVFALVTLLLTPVAAHAADSDKVVSPKFPIAHVWTVDLDQGVAVAAPPVSDNERAYLALKDGHLVAWDLHDGHVVWRLDKTITSSMATGDGLLFVSADNAIEALRGADHASVWTIPRIATTAPLVAVDDWLIAVTATEAIAIAAKDGRVIWRTPAGGVALAPAVDGDHLYVGANDGRLLALALQNGQAAWEKFVPEGVTALAAHGGIVYAGGGDKQFYCYDGLTGKLAHPIWRIGAVVIGNIAVDDERVYFAARDNVIRAVDRGNNNQRWSQPIHSRPFNGVIERGHVVFVPLHATHELPMLFAGNGKPSGTLTLPGDMLQEFPPDIQETAAGVRIVAVTGGLTNQWHLSIFATAGEPALVSIADFPPDTFPYLLTDPALQPIGKVLGEFVMGDPPLVPLADAGFPVRLLDPPLEPLTTLPGLQLRPLSPKLPPRREASQPAG